MDSLKRMEVREYMRRIISCQCGSPDSEDFRQDRFIWGDSDAAQLWFMACPRGAVFTIRAPGGCVTWSRVGPSKSLFTIRGIFGRRPLSSSPGASPSLLHTSQISTGLVPVGSQLVGYLSPTQLLSSPPGLRAGGVTTVAGAVACESPLPPGQARRRAEESDARNDAHGAECSWPVVTPTGTSPAEV